jgi:ribosomal protein S18 acetylase RimI-like enzyme
MSSESQSQSQSQSEESAGAKVVVRALRADDLADIVRIDAQITGRARPKYLEVKLARALHDGVQMSLGDELDGELVGFLMAAVYYGEFGMPEPVASIDTFSVHPGFRGRGVGRALWVQFSMNLRGLQIGRVQTQVDWTNWSLLRFLELVGFRPAPRLCLEKLLEPAARDDLREE